VRVGRFGWGVGAVVVDWGEGEGKGRRGKEGGLIALRSTWRRRMRWMRQVFGELLLKL
jgi:hypothetical protein